MNGETKPAVLHAACYPVTGPWSVMRDLARAQVDSGRYAAVGIGVIVDSTWPTAYREELRGTSLAFYRSTCPRLFGTATFLYQRLRPPPWRQWIRDLAARSQTDRIIVHLHNAWMSGVFLPLPEVPGIRVEVVVTFHGVNEHFNAKPIRRFLHRWMARRLLTHRAQLTSVDGANTRLAEEILGVPRDSFAVIPNGVHPVASHANSSIKGPEIPLTIGHVGSMIPQKGWQLVAAASEILNRDSIQVRVLLAGRGSDEAMANDWARRHAAWAEYLGFVENPRERVMSQLDVLCLMSRWEGLPMSIVEAMSVGVPVIATDVGGVSEAVQNGETGLLVSRTAESLAAALSELLQNRDRLRAMSARARQRFEERFTMDRIVERYARVYDEALR